MPSLPSRGIISLFPFVSLCCVHLSEALPRLSPFLSPCFALSDAVSAFARPPLSPLLFPPDAVSFPRPCLSLFFLLLCWMLRPPFRGLVTLLVSLMFSLLLDAVSAFQRPCLPCLPSCSPMLDAVSALPRPSHLSCFRSCFLLLPFPALCCILCLPCQGLVSLPFLSPFVGSCVASSSRGVVSLLSLLVPLLFSLCWMLCRRLCLPSFPFLVHVSVFPMPCLLSCLPSRLRSCLAFGFPLLDAVSALRGPCLPSCFPLWHAASAPCLPRPPVLYCFPWLDAVAALWRPCLPCLPSCVLCVGCCVRLSEALSPLFVFLFPQYWKPCICLSEVLSLFLFPVLFPRCWMPCRDPKALSSLYRLLFATAGSCWVSIPRSKGWYRVPPSSHYSFREPWTLAPQCLPLCLPLAFPIYNLGNLSARFVSQLVFTVCCAVSLRLPILATLFAALPPSLAHCASFFSVCVTESPHCVSQLVCQCVSHLGIVSHLSSCLFPSLSPTVCRMCLPPGTLELCLPLCLSPRPPLVSQLVFHCVALSPWNPVCRFVSHLVCPWPCNLSCFPPCFLLVVPELVSHCVSQVEPCLLLGLPLCFSMCFPGFPLEPCLPPCHPWNCENLVSAVCFVSDCLSPRFSPSCLPLCPPWWLPNRLPLSFYYLPVLAHCLPICPTCVPLLSPSLSPAFVSSTIPLCHSPCLSVCLLFCFPLCFRSVSSFVSDYVFQLVSHFIPPLVPHFVPRCACSLSFLLVCCLPIVSQLSPALSPTCFRLCFPLCTPCVPHFVSLYFPPCPSHCLPLCLPLCHSLCLPLLFVSCFVFHLVTSPVVRPPFGACFRFVWGFVSDYVSQLVSRFVSQLISHFVNCVSIVSASSPTSFRLSLSHFVFVPPSAPHFVSQLVFCFLSLFARQFVSYCVPQFVSHPLCLRFVWRLVRDAVSHCVSPSVSSIWSPLCLPLCLSLCFKLCLPLYTPVSLSLCFKLCLPLCLRLCHPCRLPLVSHFVSSVSPALPPCRPFVSHFVQTFQLASMFMGRIFDSWKQYGRQSGRHGGRQNGRQSSLRQSEGQSAGHRRRQDLFHLELGTATAVGLQSWVNFPFFHLLDALSALVFPCLPACLSCSLCCLFFGSLFPLIPFVGCCVHLSEALSPLSPLLFCLPCFPSCPPFLFPFVGCCVRLSETLFPWSLFLFPRVGGNVLSEALSPCLSPFLFPRCWMLCRDPEALSGHVSLVLLCCVPEALSPSSPFLFSLLLPYAGCCGCLLEALSLPSCLASGLLLLDVVSTFVTHCFLLVPVFVSLLFSLCWMLPPLPEALSPLSPFLFPLLLPFVGCCPPSRGLVSLVFFGVPFRLSCLLSLFSFPFFCWMPSPPFRGLVSLLVLLFSLRVVLLVSLCWMLCPPSRGLPSCPFFLSPFFVSCLCY